VEDADDDFFSHVLRNENRVLHPLLPERNDHGYVLRRRRHERILIRATMTNAISYTDRQLHKYRATNFSTSPLCIV